VVLIWLYFLAIAVLIGAGLNAASRQLWPPADGTRPEPRLTAPAGRRSTLTPVPEPDDEMPGAADEPAQPVLRGDPAHEADGPATRSSGKTGGKTR
jgi:membrane protein